jgi:undecaprenyl diphosphate synthase
MENEVKIPRHIGYIVDGNRRWARKHGLPAYEGHLAGYNVAKDISFATFDAGVQYVSAYIFSTENWQRNEEEVSKIMSLVLNVLVSDLHIFIERNVRLLVIGSRKNVSKKILAAIDNAESKTANNTAGTLVLCFNYGGQMEIAESVKKIISSGARVEDVTVDMIEQNLYAPELPPVDLVVRTSGEMRLSNFMLWRVAYSEFIFLKKLWPDMKKEDVKSIIKEYAKRFRRFGK